MLCCHRLAGSIEAEKAAATEATEAIEETTREEVTEETPMDIEAAEEAAVETTRPRPIEEGEEIMADTEAIEEEKAVDIEATEAEIT